MTWAGINDESSAPEGYDQPGDGSTRKEFLQRTSLAGIGLLTAGAMAPDALAKLGRTVSAHAGGPAGTPSRGGRLRIGMVGNGSSETFNPALIATPIDDLHGYCVFDPFIRVAPNHSTEPGLITSWKRNSKATVWELDLRRGVTFHNGKDFTADDVIYTLRSMGSPSHAGHPAVAQVQLRDLKKLGKHSVRVPLKIPIADLSSYFIYVNPSYVIQDGEKNFAHPIGTGAYKLKSFTPGQRAVFTANRDYWDHPRPYPDELEILSIDDDTARVNALLGGQIDICNNVPAAQAKANLHGGQYTVLVGAPGYALCFYVRLDQAPFNDVRVRQALRLIVDRQELIDTALSGFGTVGNDLTGYGVHYYDSSLPQRVQDIDQAKSLLKSAGRSDLAITLHTSPTIAGFVQSATVLPQQAAKAGVKINVKHELPSSYFNPSLLYLKESFAQTAWPVPSLNSWYSEALISSAPYNETHNHSRAFDQLFHTAQAETNAKRANERWAAIQRNQWERGGYIVWAFNRSTDGLSSKVRGMGGPGSGWLYGLDDHRVWSWGLA